MIGTDWLGVFDAVSVIPVLLTWFNPIEPALVPVVPVVLAVTVHVCAGAPPDATVEVIDGDAPAVPLVARVKLEFETPLTGSLNVTVHCKGPAFTDVEGPARTIEVVVGRVVS